MSEEEKTIEEQTETIIDAIENETEDDVREAFELNHEDEPVTPDEAIKDEPAKETAPVLRAFGDPDPADMNMIHKHVDNFLAMLCGETPIDDNVRTSTEYWLKRLSDGLGGSTKKLYQHTVCVSSLSNNPTITINSRASAGRGVFVIITDDPTEMDRTAIIAYLNANVGKRAAFNGSFFNSTDGQFEGKYILVNAENDFLYAGYRVSNGATQSYAIVFTITADYADDVIPLN